MPDQEPKDYVPKKPGAIAMIAGALVIVALCVARGWLGARP